MKKLGTTNLKLSVDFFFFNNGRKLEQRERGIEYPKLKRLKIGKREKYTAQALWYLTLRLIHWCHEKEQARLLIDVKKPDRIWRTQKLSNSMKI